MAPAGITVFALLTALSVTALADAPVRREPRAAFRVEPEFQQQGGVQYFFELARADVLETKGSNALNQFLPFDTEGLWTRKKGPLHTLVLRVSFTLDKDVTFFTPERVLDVGYMNAILTDAEIRREGPETFRTEKTPSNRFKIRVLDAAALRRMRDQAWLQQLVRMNQKLGPPSLVVAQENFEFARVMGFRTGERSVTVTAHYAVRPGKTRVVVHTLSFLHNIPPRVFGGEDRVHEEALKGTLSLIANLRAYPAG